MNSPTTQLSITHVYLITALVTNWVTLNTYDLPTRLKSPGYVDRYDVQVATVQTNTVARIVWSGSTNDCLLTSSDPVYMDNRLRTNLTADVPLNR